jgi:hypothetical protein
VRGVVFTDFRHLANWDEIEMQDEMKRQEFSYEFMLSLFLEWQSAESKLKRGELVKRWSESIPGLSRDILYSRFREMKSGNRIRETKRSDAGKPKVNPDSKKFAEDMKVISAIKMSPTTSRSGKFFQNGQELSTSSAVQIAFSQGMIETKYSVNTVNKWLRQFGYNSKSIRQEIASLHLDSELSNQVWMIDFSPADTIYESEKSRKLVYDNTLHIDKNHFNERLKRKKLKRVLICYMVDMHSGAYDLCCYSDIGLGENTHIYLESLSYFMREKSDSRNLISGRPNYIYTDQGPAFDSNVSKQVYRYFGIEHRTHEPGGSGTGRVESRIGAIKRRYEKLFYMAYNRPDCNGKPIQEFQEFLRRWVVYDNVEKGLYSKYHAGLRERRRVTLNDVHNALIEPIVSVVDNYGEIDFRGETYFVGWDTVGLNVSVYQNFDGRVIAVDKNKRMYECTKDLNVVTWEKGHPGKPKSEMVRDQEEIIKMGQKIKGGLKLEDLMPEKIGSREKEVRVVKDVEDAKDRSTNVVQFPMQYFAIDTAWQFLVDSFGIERCDLPEQLVKDIDQYFIDCKRINRLIQYENVMKVYSALEKFLDKNGRSLKNE